jgi:integrase
MFAKSSPNVREFATKGSTGVATPRRFHFTKRRIETLPVPTNGQRSYHYDDEVRGLAMAVTPLGKKTFILYRKVAGRPERITVGPYPDLSIEQARAQAMAMNSVIAHGGNPARERRSVRDEMTLAELFDTFLTLYAKEHKRTWKDDEAMFKLHLHSLRLRKLHTITGSDVVALHRHIGRTRGQYIANRVVELLCAMFNRARREWGYEGKNPAEGIRPFKERKRERFLDAVELPAFFKALQEETNEVIREYIIVSLLTGARRANVQEMRWDEIDWIRREWTIPPEKAKGDEPMQVVLTPTALEILSRRKASSLGEWVFPGAGKTGHLVEPKKAWTRILDRAGLQDVRLHDLRRTLGSWQAATGASLPIIGKSLGHKSLSATQIYARLDLDPVRASVNKATDAMLLAGGVAGLLGAGK